MYALFLLLCACKHSQPSQIRWPGCDTLKNATGSAVKNHLGTTPPHTHPPSSSAAGSQWPELTLTFHPTWEHPHTAICWRIPGTYLHIVSHSKWNVIPSLSLSVSLVLSLPTLSVCVHVALTRFKPSGEEPPPPPRPPFTSWITIK